MSHGRPAPSLSPSQDGCVGPAQPTLESHCIAAGGTPHDITLRQGCAISCPPRLRKTASDDSDCWKWSLIS